MSENDRISTFGDSLCLTCLSPINQCDKTYLKCSSVLSTEDRLSMVKRVMSACSIKLFKDRSWDAMDSELCPACIVRLDGMLSFLEQCINTEVKINGVWVEQIVKEELNLEDDSTGLEGAEEAEDLPLSVLKVELKAPFDCIHCGKHFKSETYYSRHVLKCNIVFTCQVCKEELKGSDVYREHLKQVHGVKFDCVVCSKSFEKKVLLKEHVKAYHPGLKEFVCHCGAAFNRQCKLNQHAAKAHQDGDCQKYSCDQCNKVLYSQQSLTNHLNLHTGLKPYLCNVCASSFSTRSNLRSHFARKHSETKDEHVKKHLCDKCGEAFYRTSHLKRHKLRRHTQNAERRHACQVCGKRFLEKSDLASHVKLHDELRPHVCTVCSKSFRNTCQLQGHVKRVHLGLRPFECTTCGSKFKTKSHLKKHVFIHTGEKPYECPHCSYTCAERSNLKKHINIHLKTR